MSQEHYVKVLEAAGFSDAAHIIKAMGETKTASTPEPEPESAEQAPAPQHATQAEADGAALLEGMRAAGLLGGRWVSAGPLVDGGQER